MLKSQFLFKWIFLHIQLTHKPGQETEILCQFLDPETGPKSHEAPETDILKYKLCSPSFSQEARTNMKLKLKRSIVKQLVNCLCVFNHCNSDL